MHAQKSANRQSRFTLVELIVVLIVLVGLGTVIVPKLPAMLERTHVSAGINNLAGMQKAVQQYENTHFTSPDNLDSLLNDNGTALFDSLPGGGQGLDTLTLTTEQADALTAAGISTLKSHDATAESATFDSYGTTDVTIAAGETVAILDGSNESLSLDSSSTYAVFGVGPASDLVGEAISEAPVHFPGNIAASPNKVYSRFGVVYDISGEKAKFVMAVALHDGSVDGIEHSSEEFWEEAGE